MSDLTHSRFASNPRRTPPARVWALASACVLIAGGAAGAANAQAAGQTLDPRLAHHPLPVIAAPAIGKAADGTARPLIDVSGPSAPLVLPYALANSVERSDFAQTAIDHRFPPGGVTGSVGYLCGLHAGPDEGAGPASSSTPVGTFLGAKLAYAF
jgi:hypothetical protein